MINYTRKQQFELDSVYKRINIHYFGGSTIAENADMYNDEFSVEDILCDGEDLTFGEACARKVTFTTTVTEDLAGAEIGISEKVAEYSEDFNYGRFFVKEERYIESKGKNKVKEVTAYDPIYTIYNTDVTDWYNGLWESASTYTQKQFRDSFFANFDVYQVPITLDNDTMTVKRTVSGKINGATVLKSILATNGCFGRMIDTGNGFEYFYLPQIAQNLSNAYEIAKNGYYMSETHAKYTTQAIDKLIIRDEDNEEIITVGSGDNAYVMANNMLLYGKTAIELQTIAQNIYNRISVVTYTPFEIEVKGNPCFQVGDPVYFTTVDGEVVKSYILRRNYTGIQSQKDTYSADGFEKRAEVTVSVNDELIKLRNKTNRLDRDLEHTTSVLEDEVLDGDNPLSLKSEIDQTADSISAEVTRATTAEGKKLNKTSPTGQTSFSWEMTNSKMEWKENGNRIMLLNSSGLEVKGKVSATSGFIGENTTNGFSIDSNNIHNGVTGMSDTSHNGIYLGKDGINLGKGNFKVTNGGVLTAKSGEIGNWEIGQYGITNKALQSGTNYWNMFVGVDTFSSFACEYKIEAQSGADLSIKSRILKLNATNNRIDLSNGYFVTASQDLEFYASNNEGNYGVKLGVTDSAWAFSPVVDGYLRLGSPNHRWTTIYAQNGTINTSDRRQKKCIKPLQEKAKDFIMDLKPVSYKFKDGDRTHYGLIAQDVEDTMNKLGLTEMDFAGLCKDKNGDDYIYGLRYDEFIPLCIKMLQMQEKKIERLEGRKK